jgi:hypothetical protein
MPLRPRNDASTGVQDRYVPAFKAVIILDFEVMLGCHLVFF